MYCDITRCTGEYLQKAGSQAAPLRPLNLTPPAAVKTQGNKPGGNMSVAAQVRRRGTYPLYSTMRSRSIPIREHHVLT